MTKGRLEAFSDGVIAILITIMVLELHPPEEATLWALGHDAATLTSYVVSFLFVAIYWNNHHHLLQATRRVNGRILWANLHLLFWLSLTPFLTAWMGRTGFAPIPVAVYGANALLCGAAYALLQGALVAHHGPESTLAKALGVPWKERASIALYAAGIALAFVQPWLSLACYVTVSVIWLVPDRRIERVLADGEE